jgi:hypothetical protein
MLGLGLFLVALGCSLMSRVQPDSTWTVLLPGFLCAGVGVGITNPVLASVSVSVVSPERSGMSTGSASTFRQVGLATGIAGLGAVFLSQIKGTTVTALHGSAAGQQVLAHGGQRVTAAITGSGVRQAAAAIPVVPVRDALLSAYQIGFTETVNHLMDIASIIAIVGAIGCLVLVRQRDFVPSTAPAPSAQEGVAGDGAGPTPVAEPTAAAPAGGEPAEELPSAAPTG